jgi:hypothetical protein
MRAQRTHVAKLCEKFLDPRRALWRRVASTNVAGMLFDPSQNSQPRRWLLKQQSRRQNGKSDGFAFVPHMCRFLGQHSFGLSKLGSELVVHLRPILPLKEGRPSPTKAA